MTATAAAGVEDVRIRPLGYEVPERGIRRCLVFARGLLVVSGACVAFSLVTAPSSWSSTTSLQVKAKAITSSLSADNTQLVRLSMSYGGAVAKLNAAEADERSTARSMAKLRLMMVRERTSVVSAAIAEYVSAANPSDLGLVFSRSPDNLANGQTYLRVAESQLTEKITALTETETRLKGDLVSEAAAAASAHSALHAAQTSRALVLRTVASEQHTLASVRGQLATLVAAEEAARERAAAAAAAKAQAQAAASAAAAAAAAAGPPTPTGITTISTTTITTGPSSLTVDLLKIRNCESGGNYADNTGNGYYGAYQFGIGTWEGLGFSGLPSAAPPATQDAAAIKLYDRGGWSSWPECAAIAGLR